MGDGSNASGSGVTNGRPFSAIGNTHLLMLLSLNSCGKRSTKLLILGMQQGQTRSLGILAAGNGENKHNGAKCLGWHRSCRPPAACAREGSQRHALRQLVILLLLVEELLKGKLLASVGAQGSAFHCSRQNKNKEVSASNF